MIPRLSIVIPSRGEWHILGPALVSCLEQSLSLEAWEVIVVCNPPNAEARSRFEAEYASPAFHWLECGIVGANRARNTGIRVARGELIYLLDDDCRLPDREFATRLLDHAARHTDVEGFGGLYVSPRTAKFTCRFYNGMVNLWLLSLVGESGSVPTLLGGNAAYRRRIFTNGFWFDESYTYGGTETEFNLRLARAGHRLRLDEGLSNLHDFSGTYRSLLWRARRQGEGKARHGSLENWPAQWRAHAFFGQIQWRDALFFLPTLLMYLGAMQLGYRMARRLSLRA